MVDEPISIRPQDVATLSEISRVLHSGSATLTGSNGEHVAIPAPLYELLKDVVRLMEDGKSMTVVPEDQEFTTERAAELLGMEHHYLIRELDDGIIPYRLVGKNRRVALRDVLVYAKRQAEMRVALAQMSRDAFEAGLYDNHTGLLAGQSDE
jgi:hypothetical protein